MYDEDSDDDDDEFDSPSDCKQLISRKRHIDDNLNDELESQLCNGEIDEVGLKMVCLDRAQLIKEDLKDPNLTNLEILINQRNLKSVNNILSTIRINEKIKLGALQDTQYTDAVILQKQVVCNLAGQKEYSEIISPQPEYSNLNSVNLASSTPQAPMIENKSILKSSKANKYNTQECQILTV